MISFETRGEMEAIAIEYYAFKRLTLDEALDQLMSAVLLPHDLLVWRCGSSPERFAKTLAAVATWLEAWPAEPAR